VEKGIIFYYIKYIWSIPVHMSVIDYFGDTKIITFNRHFQSPVYLVPFKYM